MDVDGPAGDRGSDGSLETGARGPICGKDLSVRDFGWSLINGTMVMVNCDWWRRRINKRKGGKTRQGRVCN